MYFNEEHDALRSMVAKFVDKEINPKVDEWEETTTPLHELFKKMGGLGLLGITYDEKYGGQGLDYWFDLVFLEELGHIKAGGVPMAIGVQTHMATPAIHQWGSEYLKETYLKQAIAGDMVTAIGVTESGAGSDVASLKTRAVRDGDSYVINGSKLFITNGSQADFVTLLTRTSDKPGYHSYSLFVVPTNLPGFQVSKKLDKLGRRCSDTAELFFEDMRVPAENLIGEENEGFIIQMKQFQHERFYSLPANYVGARDTIDMTVDYIKQRMAFGKPLIENQVLRHRLVDWITQIECLKQLTYHIVRMKMEGLNATKEISMGKVLAGELGFTVANGCLQMFGGTGYINESLITRNFRDTRLTSIGGGATEVMKDVIARIEGF
ncbi:MAG: acyl-CoA dehydrogenase family protein [Deltaproteobacteria bacterium]|nr:acyl-CoA dehydrogenase family protein [Deltaproteobacteria bacterium]